VQEPRSGRHPILPHTGSLQAESVTDSSDRGTDNLVIMSAHKTKSTQPYSSSGGTQSSLERVHHQNDSACNVGDELETVLDQLSENHERFAGRFLVLNHFFRRTGGQGIVQVCETLSSLVEDPAVTIQLSCSCCVR
jgi:hypothetical protein